MSLIITFLGKGGTGRTTMAIAAAKQLASQGRRVLLAEQNPGPALGILLDTTIGSDPQEIAPNLQALQFQTAVLLERSWDEIKRLETEYLRTPLLASVYGQELGVLPGMDSALALNAIRQYESSGKYDAIVYNSTGDQNTLRMLGLPEILSWYIRRFRKVAESSELWKSISPFVQPVASSVLNVTWTGDNFTEQSTKNVNNLLEQGKAAVADPNRTAAYLVTTSTATAIATAKYLWGSAQQIGLTVGGVLLNQSLVADTVAAEFAHSLKELYETYDRTSSATQTVIAEFAPLSVNSVPLRLGNDWQPLMDAMPDFTQAAQAPKPIEIDTKDRQVRLFLPGFDKKQVKLTQYGPEVTIEAGDQRRNIMLPPSLSGQPVKGAKFHNGYLIISFS